MVQRHTCSHRLCRLVEQLAAEPAVSAANKPQPLPPAAAAAAPAAHQPPNIIWFLGDQHRAQATGYAGDPNLHTPNMDFLASEGVNFSKAVSGYPLCCPFRGALLSGVYPHKSCPGHEVQMSPLMPTVATPFRESGFVTAWLGKWVSITPGFIPCAGLTLWKCICHAQTGLMHLPVASHYLTLR